MSKLPLSLFLLLLPLFFISIAAQSTSNFIGCPSSNCTNGLNISYPFWKIDPATSTQFCGYQGFGITCPTADLPTTRPTISLSGDSYYVDNINYDSGVLTLADADAADNSDCPRVRHGIRLGNLPLNFSTYSSNLSFHFDCTRVPSFATIIPCLGYGTSNLSCVHILGSETEYFDWERYCGEEVVTTVLQIEADRRSRLANEFGGDLGRGFELNWLRLESCGRCELSGGRCGHNNQTGEDMCFCSNGRSTTGDCRRGKGINLGIKLARTARVLRLIHLLITVIGVGSAAVIGILFICLRCCIWRRNCLASLKHKNKDDRSVEAFIIHFGSLAPKRYNYSQIKKMTNSFKEKLGQGGFGSVFKGMLSDGRLVAVKVLNSSKSSGQEFINEVASIGRTSHVNIVALLGFCYEDSKRALIYEFMPNGSLEKFNVPLKKGEHLGVKKLYEIAIGTARGLDYLHRGCNTRILHLDIKPHNILLDEDFCPKIADFGLAKLYSRKESIVSMLEARGTIGFIAPEVFSRNFGGVSHKSDVYSYGMMILEIIIGRKNVGASDASSDTSTIYFPHWIYKRLKKEDLQLEGFMTVDGNDFARKMILVGLWCIQLDPSQRPSINEVIEMLEGSMEALKVPPKPYFSSPPRSPTTTNSTLHSVSR